MVDISEESVWHSDGHRMYMQLNKSELSIQVVTCPGGDDRECAIGKFDCIVTWFLEQYGLDCNVGVSEVASDMEIAWMVQGDPTDADLSQVWVIPIADEAFSAWLVTQTSTVEESPEDA